MCASPSHERGGRAIEPKIRRHIVCEAERLKIFFKRTCELSFRHKVMQHLRPQPIENVVHKPEELPKIRLFYTD